MFLRIPPLCLPLSLLVFAATAALPAAETPAAAVERAIRATDAAA